MKGATVSLTISEPWDFGAVHGTGPFRGRIVDARPDPGAKDKRALLIKLGAPLSYEGTVFEYLIAAPRSFDDELNRLTSGRSVHCTFIGISAQRAESEDPFDPTWWRSGEALVGTVQQSGERSGGT